MVPLGVIRRPGGRWRAPAGRPRWVACGV